MSNLSIEYSLNTPVFLNNNILEKKIFDLARKNNINGGNGFGIDLNNSIGLLIGIIILIIGFISLWYKNDLVETEAIIGTQICNDTTECKINIKYSINTTQYSKIIKINKNEIPNDRVIKIYYQSSNPDLIQLTNTNYTSISISIIIIGIFIIIYSF